MLPALSDIMNELELNEELITKKSVSALTLAKTVYVSILSADVQYVVIRESSLTINELELELLNNGFSQGSKANTEAAKSYGPKTFNTKN